MKTKDIIASFEVLGLFFSQFTEEEFRENNSIKNLNEHFAISFQNIIEKNHQHNPWFTPDNIRINLKAWSKALQRKKLEKWHNLYPGLSAENKFPKKIGLVMAGNIPLVGFHDFLCVLLSGNNILGRLSSKDNKLFPAVKQIMEYLNPEFREKIIFTEDKLENFDAIIATGSNNSSRYFEYYFGHSPNIIRKNRNSVAILSGRESDEDYRKLAIDIFSYFGLGCRNVSKIYVPKDFDFPRMLDQFTEYSALYNHNKYANNYDYNRSVYLVNSVPLFDTGYLILKEDTSMSSPVGCLFYEKYRSIETLSKKLSSEKEKIQCLVSKINITADTIPLGNTQEPELWEYADNIDTIDFLLNLYKN
jgi:Acyl-CoA reductase (LuxC)